VNVCQLLDRLQFQNQIVVDHDIQPEPEIDPNVVVLNWQRHTRAHAHARALQLEHEARLVH
jgi:hypothetical protein